MNDAWNHALLTIVFFAAWTVALFLMGGQKILFNYDAFPDENEQK